MESTFGSISIALSALYAQRRGLEVTGQNIANVNTEGYTRQRLDLESVTGSPRSGVYAIDPTMQGQGVKQAGVSRLQDDTTVARARAEHAGDSYLTSQQSTYASIEQIFPEPSDTGIQSQLGTFWNAMHDLANNPGDVAARTTVLQQANVVTDDVRTASANLSGMWDSARKDLDSMAAAINTAGDSVATLNHSIIAAKTAGAPTSELADQRDKAVMQLSELTGATTVNQPDGSVQVFVGGSNMVNGVTSRHVAASGPTAWAVRSPGSVGLAWTDTSTPVAPTSGQTAAALQALNGTIPGVSGQLDQVANSLMSAVNTLQDAGYDLNGNQGTDFFSGTGAADIQVAITDPKLIAASSTQGTGGTGTLDGSNADAMASIANSAPGPNAVYRTMVAGIGVASQDAIRRQGIQSTVAQQADSEVAAESGVNLDEEMANMLTYQRAYEAAAKVFTTIDSTLDTLINHIGL